MILLYTSIKFFITKLLGLWLFNKVHDINSGYLIKSIIVRILEISVIILKIYYLCVTNENKRSIILQIIFTINTVTNHFINLIHVYSQYRYRNLWKLLILYKTRKTKFSDLVLILNFLLLLTATVGSSINLKINFNSNHLVMVIVDLLASQIIHFSSNLTMYQFCVFMENLIINLQEMNKEMKLIKKQLHLKLYVQLLIRKHNEIINQARIVNNVFSLHNLLLGISSTTGFIANLYHVCITIDRFDAVVLFTLIVRILFIVYYLGNIQVVVFCCEKFGNQVN